MADFYHINSKGEKFDFKSNNVYLNGLPLRDFEWSYTKNDDNSYTFSRKDINYTLSVVISLSDVTNARKIKDSFYAHFDYDCMYNKIGYIYINGWKMGVNVVKKAHSSAYGKGYLQLSVEILTRTFWTRETLTHCAIGTSELTDSKTYSYTYPYKYVSLGGSSTIINNSEFDSDIIIAIYGSCTNPYINIGGNIYQVNATVEANERLEINTSDKTVVLIGPSGDETNMFSKRSQTYNIFTKVASGSSNVTWDNSFAFDITVIEKRSEPKWGVD